MVKPTLKISTQSGLKVLNGLPRSTRSPSACSRAFRARTGVCSTWAAPTVPFSRPARDAQWVPCGTDISDDAVRHVREVLHIPAAVSAFPAPDGDGLLENRRFAAITLWYVIEHFEDLDPVLRRIRSLLIPGGIIAFSTPSAAGVSGKFNWKSFLQNSPKDHFTIWDPRTVRAQLARFGFSVRQGYLDRASSGALPVHEGKRPRLARVGFPHVPVEVLEARRHL